MSLRVVVIGAQFVVQPNKYATDNFDPQFLRLPLKLTPPDWDILEAMKGDEFQGFAHFNCAYAAEAKGAEQTLFAEQTLTAGGGGGGGEGRTTQNGGEPGREC